jgi:hypothetical protein
LGENPYQQHLASCLQSSIRLQRTRQKRYQLQMHQNQKQLELLLSQMQHQQLP